ncbi:MAG TPA: hypothetical protein VEF05_18320 [Terriglobales bacterium]|nr:hypothetical protein [Terriglobales bacterium]
MSAPAPALAGYASEPRPSPRLRLIPAIETYPRVVAFAQTPAGKVAIVGAFGLGYGCFLPQPADWLLVALSIALITSFPKSRWKLVAFGTLAVTVVQPAAPYLLAAAMLGLLLFWCARQWPQSAFGRRPVASLLIGFSLLMLSCCLIPRQSASFLPAWIAVGMLSKYIWFIGYALMDRTKSPRDGLALQAGSLQPFWGSTTTPFPKGAAYLRRIEARDAEQLAITQLKGIKLLAWALALMLFQRAWMFGFHTYLHIPYAAQALAMSVRRTPYPWYVCWVSQVLSFFEFLLQLSIFGHQFIAGCRVAGFKALRNTCRPLSSTTIIDFFNRFYFYFKELLVEFFFYPTFFRYFKRHRRLRVVAATFAAVTFGNMFFHFTRDYWMVPQYGLLNALGNFQVYAFYCVVLGTALSISQLRRRAPRTGFVRGRLLPATWVVLFYCLLDVFGSTARNYPLAEHFRFLGHLFGINV